MAKKWVKGNFSWQEGYGVFSYSHSHIDNVINYVLNQETHHQKKTFRQEYVSYWKTFNFHWKKGFFLILLSEVYRRLLCNLEDTQRVYFAINRMLLPEQLLVLD
jgi:hypothetical protein